MRVNFESPLGRQTGVLISTLPFMLITVGYSQPCSMLRAVNDTGREPFRLIGNRGWSSTSFSGFGLSASGHQRENYWVTGPDTRQLAALIRPSRKWASNPKEECSIRKNSSVGSLPKSLPAWSTALTL